MIALVVRTRRPLWKSRPGAVLLVTTCLLVPVSLLVPYLPYSGHLGFQPLPVSLTATLIAITTAYVLGAELLKRWFYRRG